jgi:hypothetical protein
MLTFFECPACNADLAAFSTVATFLWFYNSDKPLLVDSTDLKNRDATSSSSSRLSRFQDIAFFRKGLHFSLREINRSFALSSLTLLSLGLSAKAILGNKEGGRVSSQETITFLTRLIWVATTLGRLHAGYSAFDFFKRFRTSSPYFGGMILGVLTVNLVNLVSPYDFFLAEKNPESWIANNEFLKTVLLWGKQNYESSSLIVLGAAVAHFVSIDTAVDVKSTKQKTDNFVMNLRPFGYVALAASCVGAVLISMRNLF